MTLNILINERTHKQTLQKSHIGCSAQCSQGIQGRSMTRLLTLNLLLVVGMRPTNTQYGSSRHNHEDTCSYPSLDLYQELHKRPSTEHPFGGQPQQTVCESEWDPATSGYHSFAPISIKTYSSSKQPQQNIRSFSNQPKKDIKSSNQPQPKVHHDTYSSSETPLKIDKQSYYDEEGLWTILSLRAAEGKLDATLKMKFKKNDESSSSSSCKRVFEVSYVFLPVEITVSYSWTSYDHLHQASGHFRVKTREAGQDINLVWNAENKKLTLTAEELELSLDSYCLQEQNAYGTTASETSCWRARISSRRNGKCVPSDVTSSTVNQERLQCMELLILQYKSIFDSHSILLQGLMVNDAGVGSQSNLLNLTLSTQEADDTEATRSDLSLVLLDLRLVAYWDTLKSHRMDEVSDLNEFSDNDVTISEGELRNVVSGAFIKVFSREVLMESQNEVNSDEKNLSEGILDEGSAECSWNTEDESDDPLNQAKEEEMAMEDENLDETYNFQSLKTPSSSTSEDNNNNKKRQSKCERHKDQEEIRPEMTQMNRDQHDVKQETKSYPPQFQQDGRIDSESERKRMKTVEQALTSDVLSLTANMTFDVTSSGETIIWIHQRGSFLFCPSLSWSLKQVFNFSHDWSGWEHVVSRWRWGNMVVKGKWGSSLLNFYQKSFAFSFDQFIGLPSTHMILDFRERRHFEVKFWWPSLGSSVVFTCFVHSPHHISLKVTEVDEFRPYESVVLAMLDLLMAGDDMDVSWPIINKALIIKRWNALVQVASETLSHPEFCGSGSRPESFGIFFSDLIGSAIAQLWDPLAQMKYVSDLMSEIKMLQDIWNTFTKTVDDDDAEESTNLWVTLMDVAKKAGVFEEKSECDGITVRLAHLRNLAATAQNAWALLMEEVEYERQCDDVKVSKINELLSSLENAASFYFSVSHHSEKKS